jgi:hypothetical protein
MDLESQFWELCDEAGRLERAHGDNLSYERPMVEIIALVKRHPQHRDLFVRCFSRIVLWERPAPWSLAAFCMRRLRFPEIQDLVHRDAEEHLGTAYYAGHMNYWSCIMHAYNDAVWEEADMWSFYAHELRAGDGDRPEA